MLKFNKRKVFFLAIAVCFILFIEIFLRFYYGFCHTVLFQESKVYEYIPKPNQDVIRFKKHSKYNSYSMRSDAIDSNSIKILGFGDSVINGGVLTDQDSLATTLLSNALSKINHHKTQFLNISAGSWGPDNCFAYLEKQGDFGAKLMVLFVSSHDAYDTMDFQKVVGKHQSYPKEQYSSAIIELLDRYAIPKLEKGITNSDSKKEDLLINKKKTNSVFNSGFKNLLFYSRIYEIPLIIYLHADKSELKNDMYNEQGQEIIKFATKNNVKIIKDLDYNIQISDFRDNIHLNAVGQKKMAKIVLSYITKGIF